jgi:predicted hydrocarbon binding protein
MVFKVVSKLIQFISSRYLRFAENEIWFGKERVLICSLEQIVEQSYLSQKFGLDYQASVYLSAYKEGLEFTRGHTVPMKKLLNPVIKLSSETLSSFGHCTIRTIKVNEKDMSMYIAGNSAAATMYKKKYKSTTSPIDFILSGLFAGALECFSQKPAYCVELKCSAQEDSTECIWIAGSKEKVLDYTSRFFPEKTQFVEDVFDSIEKVKEKLEVIN